MSKTENQSKTEEDHNEITLTPSINAIMHNKELITLEIELNLEIESNNSKKEIKIGEASLHIVNEQWVSGSLIDHIRYKANHPDFKMKIYFKNLQHSLENLAESKIKCSGSIAYLHHFEIYGQYRGNGFAKAYLWLLLKYLKQEEINNVLLHAYPLRCNGMSKNDIQKEQGRLERLYFKSGFHILKTKKTSHTTSEGIPVRYMFCNLEKRDFSEFT